MTLYLRSSKNRTIVDIEFYEKTEDSHSFLELHSSIIILEYSKLLLDNLDKKEELISDFSDISELRGWLWENYFMDTQNEVKEYSNVLKQLREMLQSIADKYNLIYRED